MHFRDAQTGATLSGNYVWSDVAISVCASQSQSPNQYVPCAGNNCELTINTDGLFVDQREERHLRGLLRLLVATIYPPTDAGSEASADASTE